MTQAKHKDILKEICDTKRQHIASQKNLVPLKDLEAKIKQIALPRKFANTISTKARLKQNALIAEIKKASPSKGVIRESFDPVAIARAYEKAGTDCLSILTDTPYFQGQDSYINDVKQAVSLPVLRKDFILDPYQITESRAIGADCILLIMAALSDKEAAHLEQLAIDHGMDVLVESHDAEELQRAQQLKTKLIGINNRNLKTLTIDINNTIELSRFVAKNATVVCESGIYTHKDIELMNKNGIYSFLVGESLMRQEDIENAVKKLLTP